MPTIQYPASKIITHRDSTTYAGRFRQGWVTGETGGSGANLRNCAHAFWNGVDFSAVVGMIIDGLWIRIPDTTNYGLTAANKFHFYKSPFKYLASNSSELDPNDYTPAGEFSNVDGTEKAGYIESPSIARSEVNPTDTLLTAEWLQHVMDGYGIAAYRRTQPSSPTSSHYTRETLSMPVLIVEYHAPTSTGELDKATVDAGDEITINITPAEAGRTHKAVFTFGSYSHASALLDAETLAYAYTIPMTWLNNIPNSVTGIANCRLETNAGGVLMGFRDYPFTITCPGSVVPSLVFPAPTRIDNGVPSAWDQYVQGYSKASMAITGEAGAYGSTIASRSIIGAGFDSNGAAELVTGPITQSGTIIFTARVTDSRGRTKTETREINVTAYEKPKFLSAPISERCLASEVVDVAGTYILAFCEYTCTAIGTNAVSGTVKYRETGTSTWSTPEAIPSLDTKRIGAGELQAGKTYEVMYTIVDALAMTERPDYISKAEFLLDLKRNGKSIGMLTTFGDDGTIMVGGILKNGSALYLKDTDAAAILTALLTVDGTGSGLDADKCDGSHYTAGDVIAKLRTVDGPGSLLNADTLDDKHASDLITKSALCGSAFGTAIVANTTRYVGLGVGLSAWDTAFVMPYSGTLRNLYIITNGAPGAADARTFTIMVDNVATALTCVMGSATNLASDTSHSVNISAGSRVSLRSVLTSASAVITTLLFSVEIDLS